ncbi:MAG TPA: hypothetical protein VMT87_13615 [Vicinamibacteria bacterium]|nr:hypothetical protein [Vicinamibacteria bacterium]
MSQKAVGDARGGTAPSTPKRDGTSAGATPRPAPSRESAASRPASALSAALEGLVGALRRQAERNADVVDVFARALKDLSRELRDERIRREVLERRLRRTDAQVEELTRVVAALSRQGWVH